jgi:hypothetical protein
MADAGNNSRKLKGNKGKLQESTGKLSLYIKIGWTFSKGSPSGTYILKINGKNLNKNKAGDPFNGEIKVEQSADLNGPGELFINLTNGPTYHAQVNIGGLPNVATPDGLARRLTNLGFYAGPDTNGKCSTRMAWAIRAFKRVKMNNFVRNSKEVENNIVTYNFLKAVRDAYGQQPDDSFDNKERKEFPASNEPVPYCGMFGDHVYYRGSFETKGRADDIDQGPGQNGIWAGKSAAPEAGKPRPEPEWIAGDYTLYLRAYDPNETKVDPQTKKKIKIQPFWNRINLPQPLHMTQFVLFELGYWLVGGEPVEADWAKITGRSWVSVSKTETRNKYIPNGKYDRYTQWAVREFQCHAKFPNVAKEDVSSKDLRYMLRVFKATQNNPPKLSGDACYPKDGKVSGALNEATRKALQAWADGALRCPVIVYSQYTDEEEAKAQARAKRNGKVRKAQGTLLRENLWLYNDHASTAPRMYAIDYSGYYTIPSEYQTPVVTWREYNFPKPIILGDYAIYKPNSGPRSVAPSHTWANVEITPSTMLGKGGNNGAGLTDKELALFKVIRAAANFECYGFFDIVNAYDNVTISFGPCHWTLANCSGSGAGDGREMPAFLAYVQQKYADCFKNFFGNFGLFPKRNWPNKDNSNENRISMDSAGTYNDRITIQTENKENVILCGVSGTDPERLEENKYAKNWHSFYRFQMACRTSSDLHRAMWDFTGFRIRDILNKTFTIARAERRVGDYVTSEKGVAMLLRWHIRWPGHLFRESTKKNPNYLEKLLTDVISTNSKETQVREDEILLKLSEVGGPKTDGHLTEIYKSTNILMNGTKSYSRLNVTSLSGESDSFRNKMEAK